MADPIEISDSADAIRGVNALTVDVEDYFQVSAFAPYIDRSQWSRYECRIPANMDRILQLFDDAGVKGTFFFLGWVADRYPSLLRRVVDLGHEIGSHGYAHVRVVDQVEATFRDDVERAKKALEDISGAAVCGYRAASFSINLTNQWAYDVLAAAGHTYSSSIFPIRHDRYGMRDAPRFPWRISSSSLVELPVTTVEMFGLRLPCGGGGYFRLMPYSWTKWGIQRVNKHDLEPAMFYFHPWEIDENQPRVRGPNALAKMRHYVNLKGFLTKLSKLLRDFRWAPVKKVYENII